MREHGGRPGCGRDPDAGADVAHVARLLEQDDGRQRGVGERGRDVDGGAAGDRRHPGARHQRHQLGQSLRVDRLNPAGELARQVGGEFVRQRLQRGGVDRDRLDQLGAEAQRVLERVEALDDGQFGIAPRGPEAHGAFVLCAAHRPNHYGGVTRAGRGASASWSRPPALAR